MERFARVSIVGVLLGDRLYSKSNLEYNTKHYPLILSIIIDLTLR